MNIKTLRKNAGFSQKELAEIIKSSNSAIAMWEAGTRNPRTDKLPELAKALGCSIDDLFGNKDKSA